FIYYDRSILTHHALDRSNGAAYSRGIESPDSADFSAELDNTDRHAATPAPELRGITNAILQEYCQVAAGVGPRRFPPIDRELYLNAIAREVPLIEDPAIRASTEDALVRAGWQRPPSLGSRPLAAGRRFAGRV